MKKVPWFIHPLFVFITSLVALGTSFYLYLHWYLKVSDKLNEFLQKYNLEEGQISGPQIILTVIILSILVVIIIASLILIFFYYQKAIRLYINQKNFIDGFTHELKTPIASLKLFTETFIKFDLPRDKQLSHLKLMLEDLSRLTNNVDRVLNIARLESRERDFEFKKMELAPFIKHFVLENSYFSKKIAISFVGFEQKYFLSINATLLELLMTNLIMNAYIYNQSKSPELRIEIEKIKGFLNIKFIDNGIGLNKKHLKLIFNKFYQVGRSEDMSAKGNGIGLSLVSLVAKAHGWKVRAESLGPNMGSEFILCVPIKKVEIVA
jgi:two-component system phosphate regulon sensor histidine kinase PhoR